jgi:hypothetical protein
LRHVACVIFLRREVAIRLARAASVAAPMRAPRGVICE